MCFINEIWFVPSWRHYHWIEPGATQNRGEFQSHFSITCFCTSVNWSPTHLMAVFNSCISSWISSSIWAWVAHIVWASLVQFWIKLCVWVEVCKAMPVMAAVVQIGINLKMSKISHPMNHLDHRSNLVSNQEASPAMGPSSQGRWRFIGNHRLCQDWRIKRVSILKEIEELRQVYNLQFIQVTEHRVLLNCKFPIATTKGSGTRACIKYDWLQWKK